MDPLLSPWIGFRDLESTPSSPGIVHIVCRPLSRLSPLLDLCIQNGGWENCGWWGRSFCSLTVVDHYVLESEERKLQNSSDWKLRGSCFESFRPEIVKPSNNAESRSSVPNHSLQSFPMQKS